ncbi:DNA-directed RNA polymerase subunit delta [Falsibacillus albus]|uniref:Probable DNA-directed RNA polymerase subunit delta n=1 Tax=Falsibacillus albus TaxID=2478915 RepID=A0A3L7JYG0_9BACI|nr:DNA-directed RNA polymerase subunit delta [Falsibacillus albus]
MKLAQLSKEEVKEMSFIELAFTILDEKKQPMTFQEILNEIASHLELKKNEVRSRMVQFYTDLNVDGRFITSGENRWGLRAWYPVDQLEEETVPTIKPRKKKAKKVVDEDLELEELEDEDLDYDDLDDFEEEDLADDDDDDDDDDFDDIDEDEEDIDDELIEDEEYDLDDDEESEDLEEEEEEFDDEEEEEDL